MPTPPTHSTVSSGMNSLAAITLEDFIKGIWFPKLSDEKATKVSKYLSLLYGVITFALVFVAQNLGNVLSVSDHYLCSWRRTLATCSL